MVQATFIKSAVWPKNYPSTFGRAELAVAGRSNVGKSSLINALTQHKRLAKVSSTPGRTQVLNFFLINQHFMLCDLPGFGYAKVPLEMKRQWGEMMSRYFSEREPLRGLLVLLDARREPGEWERSMMAMGSEFGWAVLPVVTKVDKLKRSDRKPAFEQLATAIGVEPNQLLTWSAVTREGEAELWAALERVAGSKEGLPPFGVEPHEEIDEEAHEGADEERWVEESADHSEGEEEREGGAPSALKAKPTQPAQPAPPAQKKQRWRKDGRPQAKGKAAIPAKRKPKKRRGG